MDIKKRLELQITTTINDRLIILGQTIMLSLKLDYCPLDKLMTVVNILEINATESGVQIRFTYPHILFWIGDAFGYVNQLRITDLVTGQSEEEVLEKIRQQLSIIYNWEQRKSFDGIAPIIPMDDS